MTYKMPNILTCKDSKHGRTYYKAAVSLGNSKFKQFSGIDKAELERRVRAFVNKPVTELAVRQHKKQVTSLLAACGQRMMVAKAQSRCQLGHDCPIYLHCLDLADALSWPGWDLEERKEPKDESLRRTGQELPAGVGEADEAL